MAFDSGGLRVARLDGSEEILVPEGPRVHDYRFQIGIRRLNSSDAAGLSVFDPAPARARVLHWPPGTL